MPLATLELPVYQTPQIDGDTVTIAVPWYQSEHDEWCWAACAQMVAYYYQQRLTDQCTFAKVLFPDNNCCQDSDPCNKPIDPADMDPLFHSFGKSAPLVSTYVEYKDIRSEILAGRPVLVGLKFSDGHSHVTVAAGASQDEIGPLIWINDPDPNHTYRGWIYHSNLKLAYGLGSWQWTWKPIR